MITATGWTWNYVDQHVTLPQVEAMSRFWETIPPAALQLKRISLALGIAPEKTVKTSAPKTADEALHQALAAGLPVMEGRPDDPMLNLLDL